MGSSNLDRPYGSAADRPTRPLVEELVKELGEVTMHNTHMDNGFFNCRVWLGSAKYRSPCVK